MATRYHISDNGMPGKCSAASPEACPKTQAGDSFHGSLEEATKEAQDRFQRELGAFATSSKAEEAKEAAAAAQAKGEEIYRHPQGKIIKIDADGNVRAFKNGKELSTSATAEKLRAGYGAWKRDDGSAVELPTAASVAKPRKLTPEEEDGLVDTYDAEMRAADIVERETNAALKRFDSEKAAYDALHAEEEGRVFHFGPNGRTLGKSPNSYSKNFIEDTPEQRATRDALRKRIAAVRDKRDAAQTKLEEAGLGHRIPDAEEGNTIRVNTMAQKYLLRDELQGQISDGQWENTPGNPWEDWSNAMVIVDPRNPGRNFFTRKDNYQLNSASLLAVVGDRMIENVQKQTGNADYDSKAMAKDLADLRKVFKTKRDRVSGD